jgi:uncharacterized membrane protein YbaN (DUF454 family)
MDEKIINGTLVASGSFFLVLGIIGIFIPILPTTPFLLLTAACYARGSKKLYNWLINNRIIGEYIKNYREGKGIPITIKLITIILLWVTIGLSILIFISNYLIQILLLIIAFLVTTHIIMIKTTGKKIQTPGT